MPYHLDLSSGEKRALSSETFYRLNNPRVRASAGRVLLGSSALVTFDASKAVSRALIPRKQRLWDDAHGRHLRRIRFPSFSPDGDKVLFGMRPEDAVTVAYESEKPIDLHLIDLETSVIVRLTTLDITIVAASYSKDASRIVFRVEQEQTENERPVCDLYVMQSDGTAVEKISMYPSLP